MKVKIEVDENFIEEEVVIRCNALSAQVQAIQKAVGEIYQTKYKLYELEEMLPGYFMRISKSSILNIRKIFSLTKSISSCVVEFADSPKQVYVSRYYYKPLKEKLGESRR